MTTPKTMRPRPPRGERGNSFAELMLATAIISSTIVAAGSSLNQSASVYHYFSDGPHEALMLAQEIHEAAVLMPWDSDAGDPPVFGTDVVDIWDLDDQSFHPPRSAEYDVIISHPGWTQDVVVQQVDLNDPTTVVDPATFTGETLTELVVTVSKGNTSVETFRWWMTEPDADD